MYVQIAYILMSHHALVQCDKSDTCGHTYILTMAMMMMMMAQRRCCKLLTARRYLSALAEEASLLPTRHSRNEPKAVCSIDQLADYTHEILETPFPLYEPGHEATGLWEATDSIIQMAEFVIRGHAACIPQTLAFRKKQEASHFPPKEHVDTIQAIITRMSEQGNLYMNLRHQMRSAIVRRDEESSPSSSSSDGSGLESNAAPANHNLNMAGPGPSIEMWDTFLDSMAVTEPSVAEISGILDYVLHRHNEDGGHESNTNPFTFPTILTFNAALRGIANTPYTVGGNEQVRDEALETAFGTYDEMRLHVDRNSATFRYMLDVVAKFIPPSHSRGNIAYGLWSHARLQNVASRQVLEALQRANIPSNTKDFDDWLAKNKDIREMPLKWRKIHRVRRYSRNDETY